MLSFHTNTLCIFIFISVTGYTSTLSTTNTPSMVDNTHVSFFILPVLTNKKCFVVDVVAFVLFVFALLCLFVCFAPAICGSSEIHRFIFVLSWFSMNKERI